MTPELEGPADRAPRHSVERKVRGEKAHCVALRPWRTQIE